MIEGHVVGVMARPSHQPVAELLAEVNESPEGGLLEEVEEEVAEEAVVVGLEGDRITTEDELGWAPSTEIDVSALPSVVDTDAFMQVRVCMYVGVGWGDV